MIKFSKRYMKGLVVALGANSQMILPCGIMLFVAWAAWLGGFVYDEKDVVAGVISVRGVMNMLAWFAAGASAVCLALYFLLCALLAWKVGKDIEEDDAKSSELARYPILASIVPNRHT